MKNFCKNCIAMAGDRTRIDRLEGDHADHYTTNAESESN